MKNLILKKICCRGILISNMGLSPNTYETIVWISCQSTRDRFLRRP